MASIVQSIFGSGERTMEASQVTATVDKSLHMLLTKLAIQWQDRFLTESLVLQEDLQNAKIPLGYRDFCAHLLVPLNACRRKELYLPWKCEHERHAYEKCEYLEYKRRLKHAKESH